MTDSTPAQGTCLCGAIKIQADKMSTEVGACHCGTCRTWGGGPLMATNCGTEVTITGEENLGVFDSSPWAERGFCKRCGTHLFYRIKQTGPTLIPLGLLHTDAKLSFTSQVFIDEKPAYYDFSNETETMTGAEVFAKFGGSS